MYDAGSAVLSVVPGFSGVESAIRKEASKWGLTAGQAFGKSFNDKVRGDTGNAPLGPTRARAQRQGQESGGSFADGFKRRVEQAIKQLPKVTIGVARNEAEQQLKDLAVRMRALADQRVGVDVDARAALAEVNDLHVQLGRLAQSNPDVQVRADVAAAQAQLAAVTAQALQVARLNPTIQVDVDSGAALAQLAAVRSAASGSGLGIHALISAGALLGPIIVPAAAAAAAAVAAIGPAALAGAAGIGVAALGFVGVAGALKQMNAVQDEAAQGAASLAGQQAAVAGAERALANTRATNADAARRSAQQVASAQRTLTQAERDALAVRRELSRAQEEARRALQDLASQVRGNALDQQQANLDVAEARAELDRVRSDPAATDAERRQAEITYQRQVLQVEDLRVRGQRLQADQKAAAKAGVEGSEQVRAARQRIADADRRVGDAARALAAARRDQQAQERQGVFQLAQAQQALANATTAAGVGGTAAMVKLKQAMGELTPEGKRFSLFLFGLKDEFLGLRQAAERGLLPGVQAGIEALLPYMPQISKFIGQIGKALGGVAEMVGKSLASPFWAEFFAWLGATAGPMLLKFGKIFMAVLEGVAALMMAFGPVTDDIVDALLGFAEGFADWAKTFTKSQAFKDFIEYVTANAPLLGKLFVDLLKVGLKLLIGLAPLAESLLEGLVKVFDWLAKQDPKVLLGIAGAVAAIVAGIVALVTGPAAAIGAIVTAFVLVAGAVEAAYNRFETFRKVTDFLRSAVSGYFTALWTVAKAAFFGIAAAVSFAWDKVLRPALTGLGWLVTNVLGPAFTWLYNNIVRPVWGSISKFIQVSWAIIRVVFGLIQIYVKAYLAPLFTWLYNNVVKPVWGGIVTQIKVAWAAIKVVLSALGGYISKYVAPAFRTGVDAIRTAWEKVRDVAKAPVRFVIQTVINEGIIDNYNKIAKNFGVGTVPRVPLPKGFARGGVLPGYTPGKDVHRFISPTGGVLDLSGGEAVLRPEATRALGRDWVDAVNASARRGGRKGVTRMLGGFAGGGIIDGLGGVFVKARQSAGKLLSGAFDFLTDPGGTLRKLAARLVGLLPGRDTAFGRLAAGLPTKLAGMLAGKLDGLLGFGPGKGVGRVGGDWPASPAAQRGDSGVWRRVVAVIRATGPLSGAFGNAYRPGDPLWHGSGRAVDWMGFNQDALATHLARLRPLELIHRGRRDYAYTRGRNVGSFDEGLMEAHRNHIHVAMAGGGILPPVGTYDSGGWLPPGATTVINGTGRPEPVLTSQQFAAMAAARTGGLDLRVVVQDGVVSGLVRVEVDNAFGALADARIYNTA